MSYFSNFHFLYLMKSTIESINKIHYQEAMKFQEFMERSLLMGLYKNYQKFFVPLSKELKGRGLNLNESLILLALFFEGPREVTPSSLQQTLGLAMDQISHILKSLENKSLLQRQLSPADRRQRVLQITTPGKKKATELIKIFDQFEEKLESSSSL